MKKALVLILILILLLLLSVSWIIHLRQADITTREVQSTVLAESQTLQRQIGSRSAALEQKLDRIEAKLDRLIQMATPQLPDGMQPAND